MSEIRTVSTSVRIQVGNWDNSLCIDLIDNNEIRIQGAVSIEPNDVQDFISEFSEAMERILDASDE